MSVFKTGFRSLHSAFRLRRQQYVILSVLTASFPLVLADVSDIATGPRVMSASERPYYKVHASHARSGLLADACPLRCCFKHMLLRESVLQPHLQELWSVSSRTCSCQRRWASLSWGQCALCLNSRHCSRPTTRHVRQYMILPFQAGSFPLIFLTGIPDVSQLRQRTDVVTPIIGASEVVVNVCRQELASCILAVRPSRLRPPLRLCFETHIRAAGSQIRVSDHTPHVRKVPCLYAIREHGHTRILSVRTMLAQFRRRAHTNAEASCTRTASSNAPTSYADSV